MLSAAITRRTALSLLSILAKSDQLSSMMSPSFGNWSGNARITTDYWQTKDICEQVAKTKTEVWLEAL